MKNYNLVMALLHSALAIFMAWGWSLLAATFYALAACVYFAAAHYMGQFNDHA